MRNVAWFIIGFLFAYQATHMFPNKNGTSIFTSFIMHPLDFLEGAVFILASFIIFSYSIRYSLVSILSQADELRRKASLYVIIGSVTVITAWLYLLYKSVYVSLIIVLLTVAHLVLSLEVFKKATHKER